MKTYFAYIRVSTVKQGEHGCSLGEQKSAIEAYAQRHDLAICEWFEETETAAKQGRQQFARLTELLREGRAAGVIIHKIDRSARNLKDWAGLGELIDAGIEVLFAHEGLDMQTRGGRLAADIQAVVAADYIRNLRQEVRKGFYGRLKQGYYPLPAPRGYLDHGKARPKTIDPVQGPLVRQAFELYATGDYSLDSLRREMARRGLCQPNGRVLSLEGMSTMLRNTFYIGLMRISTTGEVFEGLHEPLVPKATFDRVQDVLEGRIYPRIEKHEFLFRRTIKCKACGRSLTGERQKGHVYYRCHDRGCRGVSLTEQQIEAEILREISGLVFDDQGLGDLRDLFRQEVGLEDEQRDDLIQMIERDIGLIDQRLGRLTDVLVDGLIDKTTYDDRRAALLDRKCELQEQLAVGVSSTFWSNVSQMFELGLTASTGYILGNDEQKREAVKLLGSNLVADGKTPCFTMRFPFDVIAKQAKSNNGGPYRGAVRTFGVIEEIRRHARDGVNVPDKVPQVPKSPYPPLRSRMM